MEYYAYDSHGNATVLDSAGNAIITAYNNRWTYTGRYFDSETNLAYFRARYFDSKLGRFIGRDPLGFVDGPSLYRAYFGLIAMDPFGSCSLDTGCEPEFEFAGHLNDNDPDKKEAGPEVCFCRGCCLNNKSSQCFYRGKNGRSVSVDCPRGVCDCNVLSKTEDIMYQFMVAVCEETNPLDACSKVCKRLFGKGSPAYRGCMEVCGRAQGTIVNFGCKKLACLSVAGELPGAECFKYFYKNGKRVRTRSALVSCESCCEKIYLRSDRSPQSLKQYSKCKGRCGQWKNANDWPEN